MTSVSLVIFIILFMATVLLQCTSIYIYFTGFLNLKLKKRIFFVTIIFFMFLTRFTPEDTTIFSKMLLFFFVLTVCVLFCFYGSVAKKVYHILFFEFIMLLEELSFSIFTYKHNIRFGAELIIQMTIYFVLNIIALVVVIFIIRLLLYFKADNEIGLSNKEYIMLTIVPTLSLLSTNWIIGFNQKEKVVSCLFLLSINTCITLIYESLSKKNYMLQKYTMIELQNKYYEENLDKLKEITSLKHDLKNILINLDLYLSDNRIEEARNQLKELINTNIISYDKLTGYIPIDAILNSKLEQIKKYDIEYILNAQIPMDIDFNNRVIDLSAILGNLLDNAIEAVLRLPSDLKREILINIKYNEEKLFIKIVNTSMYLDINFSDSVLKSEKEKNRNGIGISSIKERLDKLNGYYDFFYKSGVFNAIVILPISNNN